MRKSLQTRISCGLSFLIAVAGVALLAGCGGSNNATVTPPPVNGANTNVVVLFTSTANDKLAQFQITITGVTLTDNGGKSVTLFNRTSFQNGVTGVTEFMGLNGSFTPMATAIVPQGTYTSATVTAGSCMFTTITILSSSLTTVMDGEGTCGQGTGKTTVNLPSPITVSGSTMALSFNLQVAQSYNLTGINTYTIDPVFTLTPVSISTKLSGIDARISSVNASGNSFVAHTADDIFLTLASDANTQFQGVGGLSTLAAGMLVNLDGAIQSDGTLLAKRVQVPNTAAVTADMLLPDYASFPNGNFSGLPLHCFPDPNGIPTCEAVYWYDFNTAYHISGQFSNLQNLPFPANFDSSSLFLGQNVFVTSTGGRGGQGGLVVNDFTLVPQTVNGTVTAVSNSGGFSVYTVSVAPYQIFPVTHQLSQGPFATLSSPTTVFVYADGNTQLLQSGSISTGSLLRFRGLVFDDAGTLRMDCSEILDGVAQ